MIQEKTLRTTKQFYLEIVKPTKLIMFLYSKNNNSIRTSIFQQQLTQFESKQVSVICLLIYFEFHCNTSYDMNKTKLLKVPKCTIIPCNIFSCPKTDRRIFDCPISHCKRPIVIFSLIQIDKPHHVGISTQICSDSSRKVPDKTKKTYLFIIKLTKILNQLSNNFELIRIHLF